MKCSKCKKALPVKTRDQEICNICAKSETANLGISFHEPLGADNWCKVYIGNVNYGSIKKLEDGWYCTDTLEYLSYDKMNAGLRLVKSRIGKEVKPTNSTIRSMYINQNVAAVEEIRQNNIMTHGTTYYSRNIHLVAYRYLEGHLP